MSAGYLSTIYDSALDRAIKEHAHAARFCRQQADDFHAVTETGERNKALMYGEADYHAEIVSILEAARTPSTSPDEAVATVSSLNGEE